MEQARKYRKLTAMQRILPQQVVEEYRQAIQAESACVSPRVPPASRTSARKPAGERYTAERLEGGCLLIRFPQRAPSPAPEPPRGPHAPGGRYGAVVALQAA